MKVIAGGDSAKYTMQQSLSSVSGHWQRTQTTLLATAGAGGKHHSAVVTSDGESYTFGSNLHGQCGTGTLKSKDKAEGEWCTDSSP